LLLGAPLARGAAITYDELEPYYDRFEFVRHYR